MTRIATIGLLLAVACGSLRAQDSISLVQPITMLTVDSGSKSSGGILYLRNAGSKTSRLALSVGQLVSRTTEKGINAKAVLFGPDDTTGSQVLRIDVAPKDVAHVRVEASNLWEAGESEAPLLANGVDTLGTIRAVKYRVPFNVKLRASTTDPPELAFTKGTDFLIDLKNDDGMTYRVIPGLWIKGHSHQAGSVVLPPNGHGTIKLSPPDAWFRDASFAKPEQTDGVLTLRFDPPGTQLDAGWPSKTISFKARLMKVTPFKQDLIASLFILVLLLLGAIASLLTRYWVPNSLSRASLKERLEELAEKTRMLSSRTSSEIRVGLRVERQRLLQRMGLRWTFSPELPAVFTQVGQRIDELMKHVALTERVNELWARVEELYSRREAPSRVCSIEDDTAAINAALKKVPSSLSELDAIEKKIAATAAKIGLLASGPDAGWKKELEDAFTWSGGVQARLEKEYPDCKHLFDMWAGAWKTIPESAYGSLDARISLLRLIDRDLDALKKVDPKREAARAFAEALSNVDYRPARKALGEISGGVYQEEVVAALQDPKQRPRISMSQTTPRQYSPVYFALDFPERRLNSPAALDPVTCVWEFDDGTSPEEGWRVAHYFAEAKVYKTSGGLGHYFAEDKVYKVIARFKHKGMAVEESVGGNQVPVSIPQHVTVKEPDKQKNSRTHAEWVQLAIVVAVALLGLLAGAREQLAKLDLIPAAVALFLLGFAADSIKGALAPPKTTP